MIPGKAFVTKGSGVHIDRLASFELALRSAGIEKYNLVCVSSILPPNCKIIPKEKGLSQLKPGSIVHCVLARNDANEPHRLMAAAVGTALPVDGENYGYISEHHSFGEEEIIAGNYAENLVATMLATSLGIEFDAEMAGMRENRCIRQAAISSILSMFARLQKATKTVNEPTVMTTMVFVTTDEKLEIF